MKNLSTKIKKIAALVSLAIISQGIFAQSEQTISGKVYNRNNEPIKVFYGAILNINDSLEITGQQFYNGDFTLTHSTSTKTLLFISTYGYNNKYIDLSKNTKLDSVFLDERIVELEEVTIAAHKLQGPNHTIEKGNDSYFIPEVMAERHFDLNSLLSEIPGIAMIGGKITVIGKGAPNITINGLPPRAGELENIKLEHIKRIVVDKTPSAKDAIGTSVTIDIQLKSDIKDFFGFVLGDTYYYDIAGSNRAIVKLSSKTGKFYNYLNYNHYYNQYNYNFIKEKDFLHQPNSIIQESTIQECQDIISNHNIVYSPKYEFNENSFIDLQYYLSISSPELNYLTKSQYKIDNTNETINSTKNVAGNNTNHNLMLRYANTDFAKGAINANLGYAKIPNSMLDNNFESVYNIIGGNLILADSITTITNSLFDSDVLTSLLKYTYSDSIFNIEVGGNYNYILNDYNSNINGVEEISQNNETRAALYADFGQTFGNFTYQLGLRGEYMQQNNSNSDFNNPNPFIFAPSAMIAYSLGEQTNISASYRRWLQYPTIKTLNPIKVYVTKHEYIVGNPDLLPAINNAMDLSISFGNFSVGSTYSIYENMIQEQNRLLDPLSTNLDNYITYENFPINSGLDFYLSLQFPIQMESWYHSFSISGFASKFYAKEFSEYIDKYNFDLNKPSISVYFDYTIGFSERVFFYATAFYNNGYYTHNEKYNAQYSVDFGCAVLLGNDKNLRLFVGCTSALYNNQIITNYYPQIVINNENQMNNRQIYFAVNYYFDSIKKLEKNTYNEEYLERAK